MFNKIKMIYTANSTLFRKFWVNQFAISMLGLMVTWPMNVLNSNHPEFGIIPELAAFLFCGGLFCFLIYDLFYQLGAKDYIKVNHQNAVYDKYKALKITAVAYIPTIFVTVLAYIFYFANVGNGYAVTSLILNVIIHAMYSGLFFILPSSMNIIAFPISIAITFFFAFLGYYLASHDKYLRSFFGITVKVNKE